MEKNTEPHTLQAVPVQDRTTRWFHWINVLCVLGLVWGFIGNRYACWRPVLPGGEATSLS